MKLNKLKILLLFVFLAIPTQIHALTLGDIKVAVRQSINDRADPKLTYSDTIIEGFVNEAQRDMVNRTWCLQKTSTQTLSVRTTYYVLPNDLLAIQEFNITETSTGRTRQLEERSERALNEENPDYVRQAGSPFYYFVRHSTYSAAALEYGLVPVPSSTTHLGTLAIDYYNQPGDLSANSDIPLAGFRHLYPYHSALVYYTVSKIKFLGGDVTGGTAYMQLYEQMLKLMMDSLGRMPNYNPSFGVGTGK